MSKSVLAAGLLAVMAGAWYWALLPAVAPAAPARTTARGPASRPAAAAVRLERLTTRAVPPPAPAGVRDPFRHPATVRSPQEPPHGQRARAAQAASTAEAPAPSWPRVDLIGIAESGEGTDLVRTAVISGSQGVHHVRAGDVVEGVYRVERIEGTGVDVRLMPEDRALRLVLRP